MKTYAKISKDLLKRALGTIKSVSTIEKVAIDNFLCPDLNNASSDKISVSTNTLDLCLVLYSHYASLAKYDGNMNNISLKALVKDTGLSIDEIKSCQIVLDRLGYTISDMKIDELDKINIDIDTKETFDMSNDPFADINGSNNRKNTDVTFNVFIDKNKDINEMFEYAKKDSATHILEYKYVTGKTVGVICDEMVNTHLSKSCLKQLIFYHFLPANKNLIRKKVSYSSIASALGVSISTVKRNQRVLDRLGFTGSTSNGHGKIDIVIIDEYALDMSEEYIKENNLNIKHGGYITLGFDAFKHFLQFNSLHELRLEIKNFLNTDAIIGSNGKIKLNKEKLVEMFPSYIKKSKKLLNKIFNNETTLFKDNKREETIKDYKHGNKLRDKLVKECKDNLEKFFIENDLVFSDKYSKLINKLKELENSGKIFTFDSEFENEFDENKALKDFYTKEELSRIVDIEKEAQLLALAKIASVDGYDKVIDAIKYMFSGYCLVDTEKGRTVLDIRKPYAFVKTLILHNINNYGSLAEMKLKQYV